MSLYGVNNHKVTIIVDNFPISPCGAYVRWGETFRESGAKTLSIPTVKTCSADLPTSAARLLDILNPSTLTPIPTYSDHACVIPQMAQAFPRFGGCAFMAVIYEVSKDLDWCVLVIRDPFPHRVIAVRAKSAIRSIDSLFFIATNARTAGSSSRARIDRISSGTVLFWATQTRMLGNR